MSPPPGCMRVPHDALVEGDAHLEDRGVAAEVLVGEEEDLGVARRAFCANAQSSATSALDDVQTTPPLRPQNALMSALEFM